MMFGIRVSLGKVGSGCVAIDYCAGADIAFALILLATVVRILEPLPESVSYQELEQIFPSYDVKPINRDPYCWKRLQELAGQADQQQSSVGE